MSEQTEEFKPVTRGKRWDSVLAVYDEMAANQIADEEYGLVWEGHIGKVVGALGFSASTGSQIMWDLKRMGCVEVLREGSRGTLTQVKVLRPPTEELFNEYKDGLFSEPTQQEQDAAKEQQITFDILVRIDEFQQTLETVIDELNKLSDKFEDHVHGIAHLHSEPED